MLVSFGFSNSVNAQNFTIADIIVDGYQRISPGIIYNLLPVGIGDEVTQDTPAQIIRELSASEYFDEIEVSREGNILVVTVLERPSVAEITIEGNKVLKTEDIIENMGTADIAEGQIFTRAALEVIRQGIQDVYSSRGRYGASVDIEVEELPRNRVSIKLDINEGEESRIRHINIVGNNAFDEEEIKEFDARVRRMLEKEGLGSRLRGDDKKLGDDGLAYTCELKIDGLAIELKYKNRIFVQHAAVTDVRENTNNAHLIQKMV